MVRSFLRTLLDLGVLEVKKLDEFATCRWSQAWCVMTEHFHYLRVGVCWRLHFFASYEKTHCLPGGEVGDDTWTMKQVS